MDKTKYENLLSIRNNCNELEKSLLFCVLLKNCFKQIYPEIEELFDYSGCGSFDEKITMFKNMLLKDTSLKDTSLKDTSLKDTSLKDTSLKDTFFKNIYSDNTISLKNKIEELKLIIKLLFKSFNYSIFVNDDFLSNDITYLMIIFIYYFGYESITIDNRNILIETCEEILNKNTELNISKNEKTIFINIILKYLICQMKENDISFFENEIFELNKSLNNFKLKGNDIRGQYFPDIIYDLLTRSSINEPNLIEDQYKKIEERYNYRYNILKEFFNLVNVDMLTYLDVLYGIPKNDTVAKHIVGQQFKYIISDDNDMLKTYIIVPKSKTSED